MTPHHFLDGFRKLHGLAERRRFAPLHEMTCNSARSRLFAVLAEYARQLLIAVIVHDLRCRQLATLVEDEFHALEGGHQRTVPLDDRGMFPGTLAP